MTGNWTVRWMVVSGDQRVLSEPRTFTGSVQDLLDNFAPLSAALTDAGFRCGFEARRENT